MFLLFGSILLTWKHTNIVLYFYKLWVARVFKGLSLFFKLSLEMINILKKSIKIEFEKNQYLSKSITNHMTNIDTLHILKRFVFFWHVGNATAV